MCSRAPKSPNSSSTSGQQRRGEIPSNKDMLFGFPVSNNQFGALEESEIIVSQNRVQGEDSLVNPRTMRIQRLQAAKQTTRVEDQGIHLSERVSTNIVPPIIENDPAFFNSLSIKIMSCKLVT